MSRFLRLARFLTLSAASAFLPAHLHAQDVASLAGVWTLNRSLSESPPELGFNIMPSPSGSGRSGGSNGTRSGRRGGDGSRRYPDPVTLPESYEDARRLQLLTTEARNPPVRLMIVDTPPTVTITNELGQSRALHPDGREDSLALENVPIMVTAKRDGGRLVVVYNLREGRAVHYTYSRSLSPSRLIVEVEFTGPGGGDKAKRVYESGMDSETSARPSGSGAAPPASTRQLPAETFDQRPGVELRGLKSLGILVEDLSTQAVSCGLNRDAIEAALSKRLTDAGFAVRKNSDDDTYVYVNVMTTTLSAGMCVSRYDAFLYTHATANLSYRDQPVLVQVSLIHRGGIGSSAPTAHAAAVAHGLENFIDTFINQIRDANR